MKRLIQIIGTASLLLAAVNFISCKPTVEASTNENNKDNSEETNQPTTETNTSQETPVVTTVYVTKIDGSKTNEWNFVKIPLGDYNGQTIAVDFSTKMLVENKNEAAQNLMWQIYDGSTYPTIASKNFETGTSDWETVTGTNAEISIQSDKAYFFLNANSIAYTDLTIYLDAFALSITAEDNSSVTFKASDLEADNDVLSKVDITSIGTWLSASVPSLYETYKDYFDYFGFAVEYGNNGKYTELHYPEIQNGLKKHANTISLGNEFKPDFVFNWGWWNVNTGNLTDFAASNGKTVKVPGTIPTFALQDEILNLCKSMNIHMRGHVLLWHSQTPDRFFRENFAENGNYVDAETMDARLEWYIKTVIQHCDTFKLKDGTPVIWAWDVANEATSDNSESDADTSNDYTHWLRTSGSKWYDVYNAAETAGKTNYYTGTTYKAYDFVINAFRFANKYANANTQLVYNDYGGLSRTSTSNKHKSQLRLVQLILDHKNDAKMPTRIDAMGLQSHYNVTISTTAYETEIKDFINKGLDVQITELDIATCADYNLDTDTVGCAEKHFNSLAEAYYSYMQMFIKNRKTSTSKGINCVTIWGLSDEQTWLNTQGQRKWIGNCDQYPLLFNLINSGATQTYNILYNDETNQANIPVAEKPDTKPANVIGYYETFDDGDSYKPKPAFYSVINAAKNYPN